MDNESPNVVGSKWSSTVALLEQSLLELQKVAPVGQVADLRRLIPVSSGDSFRLVLVELIKFDLAAAAELGVARALADYLREFSAELPAADVPIDLVLEEIQIRRESGLDPEISEYADRFPHLRSLLPEVGTRLREAGFRKLESRRGLPPQLEIGAKVSDFRILRNVGQGAFANVYMALQETMQRLVALKVSQRSSEEPQTLSQLDHPNIVRVYDERNLTEPAMRLLYMQFVGGGTLADCLKGVARRSLQEKSGRDYLDSIRANLNQCGLEATIASDLRTRVASFDWPTLVAWVGVQLAEGLDYAHHKGIVHRDIKPANILLAADASPKLADFNVSFCGLAGRAGAAAFFGGSLAYMSPEQLEVAGATGSNKTWDAADLDGRADLFSLGVVLWEMLHGQRPWKLEDVPGDWTDALEEEADIRRRPLPVTDPEQRSTGFRILDRTVRQCLSNQVSDRPESGAVLARQMRLALCPRAANRLFSDLPRHVRWIANWPPWLVLTALVLVPNVVAAVFNFFYNSNQIVSKYPELWSKFFGVSSLVNGIFFPVGIIAVGGMIVAYSKRLRSGKDVASRHRHKVFDWRLGHRVALVCGALWLSAGLVFPLILLALYQSLRLQDAIHFFSSLTICGGVAMVYPFFLLTQLNLQLYYPQTVLDYLSDPDFRGWSQRLRRLSRLYLLAAAAIPLVALALLVLAVDSQRQHLMAAILATAVGFGASYWSVQSIDDFLFDVGEFMVEGPAEGRARG